MCYAKASLYISKEMIEKKKKKWHVDWLPLQSFKVEYNDKYVGIIYHVKVLCQVQFNTANSASSYSS